VQGERVIVIPRGEAERETRKQDLGGSMVISVVDSCPSFHPPSSYP
jgi:hypothetical protein